MVHFCQSGLFWECDALRLTSDILPISYVPSLLDEQAFPAFSIPALRALCGLETDQQHMTAWLQIVQEYSAMELSWPNEDKFAACGGVATVLARKFDDEYIAGFYRHGLVYGLRWSSPAVFARRAKEWRAPSWSWASMDGPIFASRYVNVEVGADIEMDAIAKIISLDHQLESGQNPYGPLRSATLTLESMATEVEMYPAYGPHELTGSVKAGSTVITLVSWDDIADPRDKLIVLMTEVWKWAQPIPRRTYEGLVLALIQGDCSRGRQVFKRVGAFSILYSNPNLESRLQKRVVETV